MASLNGAVAPSQFPPPVDSVGEFVKRELDPEEDRIEVPIIAWPVAAARAPGEGPASALVRISAQRYNQPDEYQRLADALARRLEAPQAQGLRSLMGRLRGR